MSEQVGDDLLKNICSASQCSIRWDSMIGSDLLRQCPDCGLNNYDFSNLGDDAIIKLISENDINPSKKLYRRADGKYMTRNCPVSKRVWSSSATEEAFLRVANELGARFIEGDTFNHYKSAARC